MGQYLTRHLENNHEIYGLIANTSGYKTLYDAQIKTKETVVCDIADSSRLYSALNHIHPDVIINLAGISSVAQCESNPQECFKVNALPINTILEWACRPLCLSTRIFQIGSINVFEGCSNTIEVSPNLPYQPLSTYAMAKAYAAYQVGVYRSTYNLKATNVFMGQNDSALRGANFFTQRVVQFLTNYSRKRVIEDTLKVGDLDILRNWGHTEDYTNILASLVKEDYVGDIMVAPGTVHSTKDFINGVARHCGIDLQWSNWFGYDGRTGNLLIEQNPALCRPKQPKILTALNTYSYKLQHNFDSIIEQMVNTSLGT